MGNHIDLNDNLGFLGLEKDVLHNLLRSEEDVLHNFLPFIKVYKDGRVERYILTEQIPAGPDPITGGHSKDIVISKEPEIGARIFLPKMDDIKKKIPILVHYHGGGFCTGSAYGPINKYTNSMYAHIANIVTISIDYRLAPEHPLPAAYDDAYAAFKWILSHANGTGPEPWLNEYVDFSRGVYFGAESAGANIAHDVVMRASVDQLDVRIRALTMIHPYFSQREPDRLIKFLYPGSSGANDDPRLFPGVDPNLSEIKCEKIMVCVAEKDMMLSRGVAYYEALMKSGWGGKAEFIYNEGEGHCFYMLDPNSTKSKPFLEKVASFIIEDN